jgi:hypothetical protein
MEASGAVANTGKEAVAIAAASVGAVRHIASLSFPSSVTSAKPVDLTEAV